MSILDCSVLQVYSRKLSFSMYKGIRGTKEGIGETNE